MLPEGPGLQRHLLSYRVVSLSPSTPLRSRLPGLTPLSFVCRGYSPKPKPKRPSEQELLADIRIGFSGTSDLLRQEVSGLPSHQGAAVLQAVLDYSADSSKAVEIMDWLKTEIGDLPPSLPPPI